MYTIDEVKGKIIDACRKYGISVEHVEKALNEIKRWKKNIRGVGVHPTGWLWIAMHQPSKFIWEGVVFSPLEPRGEWGSFYLWDPEEVGAEKLVEPNYRYKVTPEELEEARRRFKEVFGL